MGRNAFPGDHFYALLIIGGQGKGQRLRLAGEQTLGRGPDCDLRVLDPMVSKVHARLIVESSGILVEDLNSTNGTSVNGARITRRHRVIPGDSLFFGPVQTQILRIPGGIELERIAAASIARCRECGDTGLIDCPVTETCRWCKGSGWKQHYTIQFDTRNYGFHPQRC